MPTETLETAGRLPAPGRRRSPGNVPATAGRPGATAVDRRPDFSRSAVPGNTVGRETEPTAVAPLLPPYPGD